MHVNIITVPDMVQLDITGPYEVLARTPGWTVNLVAATPEAVRTDRGLRLLPNVTRATAKPSNILVIPGGTGIDTAMLDPEWVEYVRKESAKCDYVFGVCTGSLLLGAAGVLKGKRAGGHWQARDMLTQFGATVSNDRMTRDGNIYTSGGVTSGIDMALRVVADIAGLETAQKIQLAMEYDPAPPFAGGTPYTSPPDIVAAVLKDSSKRRALRESMVAEAAQRLNRSGG
ncbi:transcriptional regulator containing an amidase domain and an AraC-type DNA-binding HTH domain [Herbaspirillum sp. CF444]|uniref:DJ-1/PfpI family protein n=1 Tax=Herbaspirillum sp. CF444 TaxID=1144319 RepID=UPI00027278C2|nr:DJ-1/PfpI family protein [Herbaspirillum sp. CF444]EJL92407.1 transcriptional regulator containing an amidase domain and an AraC-type DNA-binding HTH domain [Herbaspirillum sp. CF444]